MEIMKQSVLQFEYKVMTYFGLMEIAVTHDLLKKDLTSSEDVLNELGKDGWELLTILREEENSLFIFKRSKWVEKQGEQPRYSIFEIWKDMRLEIYQQASGNRHEPNCSDDTTKMFSLNDIDEIVEKMSEQKLADKVESKFKIKDWIVDKSGLVQQVLDFRCGIYTCTYNSFTTDCESNYRLWTIRDAKNGDVLVCNKEILLFKSYSVQGRISLYCWYNRQTNNFHSKEVNNTLITTKNKICPATKEQRDALFDKMKDAGYEWDAKSKELKKIESSTAWSEEDESRIKQLLGWIDTLKNYIHYDALVSLELRRKRIDEVSKLESWLKSIKDRVGCEANFTTMWKPSEEQKDALLYVVQHYTPKVTDKFGWDSVKILELMYHELENKVMTKK